MTYKEVGVVAVEQEAERKADARLLLKQEVHAEANEERPESGTTSDLCKEPVAVSRRSLGLVRSRAREVRSATAARISSASAAR